ncbi:MAG TPA: FAD-dependent oxidoreductase [Negativicutes bacterium]|nr:FAD-dependent oxidoreductase [Negativicutes bacterium]
MNHVIVAGGGWSGCAAALAAAKAGARVTLFERTDMLLGTGLVGGIFRNNGRFTAAEELMALGAGELFRVMDENARHKNVEFPGHRHASLYDVTKIEPAVRRLLLSRGIDLHFKNSAIDVVMAGKTITAVLAADGSVVRGDAVVDTTGTFGPMGNCLKYGNGCAMCILRCPAFGPRVSITRKAGIPERYGVKQDGTIGAMSGSCKLHKDSLSKEIAVELEEKGVAVIPLPAHLVKKTCLSQKACVQYALDAFAENLVLLDTGHAKLMTPFFQLDRLREVPGLENARFEDPYAGGMANSIRYMALAPRDNSLKVPGVDNLYCGGEKTGTVVGHTEAIVTGTLAGHNAVRGRLGREPLILPPHLAVGDFISFVGEQMKSDEGRSVRYTFAGAGYFARMKERGLYSVNPEEIREKTGSLGLTDVFACKLQ